MGIGQTLCHGGKFLLKFDKYVRIQFLVRLFSDHCFVIPPPGTKLRPIYLINFTSSQPPYAAPTPPQDPASFHYYTRDTRRAINPQVVTENPTAKLIGNVEVPYVTPPGNVLYNWQKSAEQPQAGGYYPITNFK